MSIFSICTLVYKRLLHLYVALLASKSETIDKPMHKEYSLCFKAKPTRINPLMNNLSEYQLTSNRPFLQRGVDYAGPFQLKGGKYRNRKIIKGYAAPFISISQNSYIYN